MDEKRKKEILSDIKYNNALGSHTFSWCECRRQGCRADKCNLCLREELEKLKNGKKEQVHK